MHEDIKREIIARGCALLDEGLIVGTWGNLSARIPGAESIAITPSGRGYRTLAAADIPIVSLDGAVVEGALKPSSELALHLAIYRARPDIGAVIHTHSTYATVCAVARAPIPPIVEDLAQLAGGQVEVADYAICGSETLAQRAVKALGRNFAVLLANHGAVGCGANLHEAAVACALIEKTAKIYVYASQFPGGAKTIDAADVERMHAFYLQNYRQCGGGEQ